MSGVQTRHSGVAQWVAGIVLSASLMSSVPALAQCVPNPFAPALNWLQAQENAGGHTIARHVGKTDQWLITRYNNNVNIAGASTYASVATATQFIQAALAIERVAYNAWEANANVGDRRASTTNLAAPIGRGVAHAARPATLADVQNENQVRAVMVKSGAGACYLLTSYPTP
jgi:hypothetical protein